MFSVSVSIIFDLEWMARVTRSGVLVLEVSCKILHSSFLIYTIISLSQTSTYDARDILVHIRNPLSPFPNPIS